MGCYHESEPSTDEESGLDVIPVRKYITDNEFDHTLKLQKREGRTLARKRLLLTQNSESSNYTKSIDLRCSAMSTACT
jgi:hypothetical protein